MSTSFFFGEKSVYQDLREAEFVDFLGIQIPIIETLIQRKDFQKKLITENLMLLPNQAGNTEKIDQDLSLLKRLLGELPSKAANGANEVEFSKVGSKRKFTPTIGEEINDQENTGLNALDRGKNFEPAPHPDSLFDGRLESSGSPENTNPLEPIPMRNLGSKIGVPKRVH